MCGFRSITALPHSIVCIPSVTSRHRDQFAHKGKTINVSFQKFKGKDTFFVGECLRQKGLEKLWDICLKANINFVHCTIDATIHTPMKRFYCEVGKHSNFTRFYNTKKSIEGRLRSKQKRERNRELKKKDFRNLLNIGGNGKFWERYTFSK